MDRELEIGMTCKEKRVPTKQLEWLCVSGHRAERTCVCERKRDRDIVVTG